MRLSVRDDCKIKGTIDASSVLRNSYVTANSSCNGQDEVCAGKFENLSFESGSEAEISLSGSSIAPTVQQDPASQVLAYTTFLKYRSELSYFMAPKTELECVFTFNTGDYELRSATNNFESEDCSPQSDVSCLYFRLPNGDRIELGKLETKCENSNSVVPHYREAYTAAPCNSINYLENVEFYENAQCERRKCNCLEGFSNDGWTCKADVKSRTLKMKVANPFLLSYTGSDTKVDQFVSAMKEDLKESLP